MQNKLEKFLIAVSGLLAVAVGAMGLKIKADADRLEKIKSDLAAAAPLEKILYDAQSGIGSGRATILDTAGNAAAPDVTKTTVTKTVVPGAVVPQVVNKKCSGSKC
jgi:hypothetical protein